MASSRGRERAQQRGPRVFVFGSSTPRDLSHMNKIPTHLRQYNVKIVKASPEGPSLSEYMKKARSLTRDGNSVERSFVFGSSTPRDLAHLTTLKPAQRRYDAVLPKKSSTTPNFVATPVKRSSTVQPTARLTARLEKDTQKHDQIDRLIKDDDVSSEPDLVQDRGNFLNELKEMKEASKQQEMEKKLESAKEHHTDHFEHPKEIGSEMMQSQVIPPNYHEEEIGHTVSHQPAPLQDQMQVADLSHHHEEEADPVEMTSQKVGELLPEEGDVTPREENKSLQDQ